MDLLHTLHVPPGEGPFPTIIALHGWGASAHDLLGLAPHFPDERFLTLCPQGTTVLPIAPGMNGYGWFPLVPGTPPDPRGFLKGSAELRSFVEKVPERYPVDPAKTVVLGFSQGGMMGFDLALREPERFAGLIALSTYLPEVLASNLPQTDSQKDFPVLMLHGTQDQVLEIGKARESKPLLEGLGVDLEYHELEMAHEIRPDGLRLIDRWLRDKVLA